MIRNITATLFGLLALGVVFWLYDPGAIADVFVAAGAAIVPVLVARLAQMALVATAWSYLCGIDRPAWSTFMWLRLAREGINTLLPVAQIGGEVIGARLLAKAGVPGARAGASVMVDVMLQVGTQLLFTLAGFVLLLWGGGGGPIAWAAGTTLAIGAPAILAFFLLQRHGFRLVERFLIRQAERNNWSFVPSAAAFNAAVQATWADRQAVRKGFVVHLITWFFGTVEVWIVLHVLGYPISWAEALVIESLAQAVRGAAFAVPGAIGVQEGGFVALCAIYGVAAPAAVAMSLVKRVADVVIGLPGLAIWYVLEIRNVKGLAAGRN